MADRDDARRWAALAAIIGGPLVSAACHGPPSPPRVPCVAPPRDAALPLCGVLIDRSAPDDPDHTGLLVPEAPDGPRVRRYDVVNRTQHPAPLVVYAGWWLCVTAGRVVAEPGAAYDELGTIEISDFTIDQYSAERGQE